MAPNNVVIQRLALLATIIGGGYAAYKIFQELKTAGKTDFFASTYNAIIATPPGDAATAGFSNFARRADLDRPLDIADQPLDYGQVNPI